MEKVKEKFDEMLTNMRKHGLRAIALSNQEEVRKSLLSMMESLELYELRVKKVMDLNSEVDKVVVNKGEGISEELVSELGPKSEIIELSETQKSDDISK